MDAEPDAAEGTGDNPPESSGQDGGQDGPDGDLLSDLSVNAAPIGIIVAFTLVVVVFSPGGAGDSVLLFHGALIGGVVVVSAVAGWAIRRGDSPLEGSAGRSNDTSSERE